MPATDSLLKNFTPEEQQLILSDAERLIKYQLSSKAILRLYATTLPERYDTTPWGISKNQTPATFSKTCQLAYYTALKRENRKKKALPNSLFSFLFKIKNSLLIKS